MPLTNPQATVGLPLDAVIPGVIQALPLPVNDASHALLNGRFRPALRTVMREAESDINVVIRDSTLLIYPGISHRAMVPASNAALHAAAKDEHVTAFGTLLSALPGFSLQGEDRYMFAFHAGLDPNTHTPRAFFITEWNELVEQIRTYLPAGRARAITLDHVAYIVMSMMQMLAFTPDTDGARPPKQDFALSVRRSLDCSHRRALLRQAQPRGGVAGALCRHQGVAARRRRLPHRVGAAPRHPPRRRRLGPSTPRRARGLHSPCLGAWVVRGESYGHARRWGRLYTTFGASPHHRRTDRQRRL